MPIKWKRGFPNWNTIKSKTVDTEILGSDNEPVFSQKEVKVPEGFSQRAANIAANQYFRGVQGTKEREMSFFQVVDRVVRELDGWADEGGYFEDEKDRDAWCNDLRYLLLNQMVAFNSPAWYNLGVKGSRQQASACFIGDVEDDMDSISERLQIESRVFKWGGGFGANNSKLRGSNEPLSAGGYASGPVSFMRVLDANAEVVRSAGIRRASKIELLDADHPDIFEFVNCKGYYEEIARLIKKELKLDTINDTGVPHQNANHSVVVTDTFMQAVITDQIWTLKNRLGGVYKQVYARELFKSIVERAHQCGDPGLFFYDTINRWNPVLNCWGSIVSCNPCVVGDTFVATDNGFIEIQDLVGQRPKIVNGVGEISTSPRVWETKSNAEIVKVTTNRGRVLRLTPDHKVKTKEGMIEAKDLVEDLELEMLPSRFGREAISDDETFVFGLLLGDGCLSGKSLILTMNGTDTKDSEEDVVLWVKEWLDREYPSHRQTGSGPQKISGSCRLSMGRKDLINSLVKYVDMDNRSIRNMQLDERSIGMLLSGLFTADGCVVSSSNGTRTIELTSVSEKLLQQVMLLLDALGIYSVIYDGHEEELREMPGGEYLCKKIYSLRIPGSEFCKFASLVGFHHESPKAKILNDAIGSYGRGPYKENRVEKVKSVINDGYADVYDLTEPSTHLFSANGICVSNCAEFIQPPNSACNLASLNLLKFFRINSNQESELCGEATLMRSQFHLAVHAIVIALDLIARNADYPDERIAENSRKYRPLGLGYTNLGALLISLGMPYDSSDGRNLASAITALMSGYAWNASSEIKEKVDGQEDIIPREDMLEVMRRREGHLLSKIDDTGIQHLQAQDVQSVWEYVIQRTEKFGVANSQTTLLAPTGTISFLMDAETTGIEPLPMLGGIKKMSNRGVFNFTLPDCVKFYLRAIGMIADGAEPAAKDDGNGNLEWNLCPEYVRDIQDAQVLDTAMGGMGMGTISYHGHVEMMAAVQPYLCGAISKTVNLPNNATFEDVYETYIDAWKKGLKSIAIYRDGSKFEQPLNPSRDEPEEESVKEEKKPTNGLRLRLPTQRNSITHKFQIGEHKGYLTAGLYPDNRPGELFINMAKQGSTVRGLLDWGAILVSMCLQYGVPLEDLVEKFKGVKFEPQGMTRNDKILFAQSPVDYIFRWLENTFLKNEEATEEDDDEVFTELEASGEPCSRCGSIMLRRGSCFYCDNCDISTGCS